MLKTPAKQTATSTIETLSGRLQSATLLEDRRAAILGLRSFAKEYPASVASGALRGLIGCLGKDNEDVDTVKVVLETVLWLFNPNENSPEASEEIGLWLADEFSQRQDNITILLDLLETNDFYSRLYSLQIISAILRSRPERTEECVLTAPLGISRLVAVLEDSRDVVRNEGVSVLIGLTPSSTELQKLVAFESAFDRIFNVIQAEGSLSHGDRVVEDCLVLLANLLRLNPSNQSFFRETGCAPKLARLLGDALQGSEEGLAEWAKVQRNRNLYALLAVIRLFLVRGGAGTHASQDAFAQSGVLARVLELAFSHSEEIQIRSEALTTCADLIRGNPPLQEGFAQFQVVSVVDEPPPPEEKAKQQNGVKNGVVMVYVIDGLLDLTLSVSALHAFDSRMAAFECLKAYLFNHKRIRMHFLERAIGGFQGPADETANVLTILMRPLEGASSNDPYRHWFAALILYHLVYEDSEAKALAIEKVKDGDAAKGEEEVTCIQTISANLITGFQKGEDDRVIAGYLMLLCGWLFEDPDSVNDFLGEGSNVQTLVQAVLQPKGDGMIQGLCAVLLGIVYEFSTKDSPVPRGTLHPILASRLGRDQYIDRIKKLRSHPLLRDFEVLPQRLGNYGGLPDVFFEQSFVDFIKDNFSRILRAIDRDPGFEVPVIANGVQKGISRELVDSLRSQLEDKTSALQAAESNLQSLERKLHQEQVDHRKAAETSTIELARIKHVNEALLRHHEEDMQKLQAEHKKALADAQKQLQQAQKDAADETAKVQAAHDNAIQDLERRIQKVQKEAEETAERVRERTDAEIADLKATITKLEADLEKTNKNHLLDLQTAHTEYKTDLATQKSRTERAEAKAQELLLQNKKKAEDAERLQSELDDTLMLFEDLEERVGRYKRLARSLGGSVSEGDDEDGKEDGDGDEEDGDEGDEKEGEFEVD